MIEPEIPEFSPSNGTDVADGIQGAPPDYPK